MHTRPEDSDGDTLEFPTVVGPAGSDPAGSDFAERARNGRRRSTIRRTGEAFADFAKEAPEMVIGFIEGLLP